VQNTTVAKNYAEAVYDLASRTDSAEAFAEAFDELTALLDSSPLVKVLLETPKVSAEQKKQALQSALAGRVPPLFLNFVMITIQKRRQAMLAAIGREFQALLDEKLGRVHVQVTLAHEADERTEEEIGSDLSRVLGKKAIPHIRVNAEILGGIIVRYGDRVMDGSLRHRLVGLKQSMLRAPRTNTKG
jgi:F-type H+-transporting ATPase subunit delta